MLKIQYIYRVSDVNSCTVAYSLHPMLALITANGRQRKLLPHTQMRKNINEYSLYGMCVCVSVYFYWDSSCYPTWACDSYLRWNDWILVYGCNDIIHLHLSSFMCKAQLNIRCSCQNRIIQWMTLLHCDWASPSQYMGYDYVCYSS